MAFDFYFVGLIDKLTGMHEDVGQFPVICHEQQSFCILIQTAYGINPLRDFLKIIHDRFTALVIMGSRNDAFGFIEQVI